MVIIHIANIDTAMIGGVQVAVPEIVKAQSQYATVGLMNTRGEKIDGVCMLEFDGIFETNRFPKPFNKPDIVVFHEVYRFEYIRIYRTLIDAQIPYIIIPHGCLSKKAQHKKYIKKHIANFLFFENFIKSSSSIQYLSDNEKRMSAFSRYPSFVSGNGVLIPNKTKTSFSKEGIKIACFCF